MSSPAPSAMQQRRVRMRMFTSPRPLPVDLCIAAVSAFVVDMIGVAMTIVAQRFGASITIAYRVDDLLTGIIVGIFFLAYLRIVSARKTQELKRLRDIGEMNHHVRNALQVISTSYMEQDAAERLQMVSDAVNRIERALREFNV